MMPAARNILLLAAILVIGVVTAEKKTNRLRKHRRSQIYHHHADSDSKMGPGLEEDIIFWRDMTRKMQVASMSIPGGGDDGAGGTIPGVPTPTPPAPAPAPSPSQGGTFKCPQVSI